MLIFVYNDLLKAYLFCNYATRRKQSRENLYPSILLLRCTFNCHTEKYKQRDNRQPFDATYFLSCCVPLELFFRWTAHKHKV